MGVHDGHRQRLIRRFLEEGLDSFESHNVLELLLFFSIPRRDTNEIAHALIADFGSLDGVFDAPYEELLKVDGVGDNTAALIKLIPQLTRRYLEEADQDVILNNVEKTAEYFRQKYIGRTKETVFLACLDAKCRVIACPLLHEGSVNFTEINTRKIMEQVLRYNAAGVILAHNHPSGIAAPSMDDLETTQQIKKALRAINVDLVDHIIVADRECVSLAASNAL